MMGGEGWFLAISSITVCMPDIYIDRVKGDGFLVSLFRFPIIYVYACVYIPARTGGSSYVYYNVNLHLLSLNM